MECFHESKEITTANKTLSSTYQDKGNIYCNKAGAQDWYDGKKTEFTMTAGPMVCEPGNKYLILM